MNSSNIFFNGDFKQCVNCKEIKRVSVDSRLSDFYKHSGNEKNPNNRAYYRPYCKVCWNRKNVDRAIERLQAKSPSSFWDCENCDTLVRVKHKVCNRCGYDR